MLLAEEESGGVFCCISYIIDFIWPQNAYMFCGYLSMSLEQQIYVEPSFQHVYGTDPSLVGSLCS